MSAPTAATYSVDMRWPLAFVLVIVTILAYQPVWHAGFVWDDQNNITDNQLLRTTDGLQKTWVDPGASIQYYPLTYTGFWIEYQLWGMRPLGYHVVNVVLHALNAFLLGVLLTRLSAPGAWLAAFIFAVHPVHVESVAWITELKNVLSGFFFFGAFLAYLRFVDGGAHRGRFYGLALFLFLCAVLSKTATIALPAVILLVLWWKEERVGWRQVMPLIPFFLVAVCMAALTNWVEKHYGGALGPEWQMSFAERGLVAGRVVWFYAGKLLWPVPLVFIYPRWQINPGLWWQYVFPVGTVAVLVMLWLRRHRWGKGPFVAVFFFVGALVPVPAFFNLYFMRFSYVTDHFQYLPSIGLIALASGLAATVLRSRQALITVAAPVVVVLAALSWQHCHVFHDNETIWRDTIAKNPGCWMAHNNLGRILREAGDVPGAIQHYEAALQIKPDYAEPHYNLGNAFLQLGRIQDAIEHYERALQIDPDYLEVHNNLASALFQAGKARVAIAHLEQAVGISPDSTAAHYNLGNTLIQMGQVHDAMRHYEQAVRLKPDFAEAHYGLGVSLAREGKSNEAIAEFSQALRYRPDYPEAHQNLGAMLANKGNTDEAISHVASALRLYPDYPEAHYTLAILFARQGKIDEAISHLQSAVKLMPNSEKFQRVLDELQRAKIAEKSD